MTIATYITIARLFLVPAFVWVAILYSRSVESGSPEEWLRWFSVIIFIVAAVSDGVDGALARRMGQRTKLGAFLDPIADKSLLLGSIITLSIYPWGEGGWIIPAWFSAVVIARDCIILGGIVIIYQARRAVPIIPHWTGKVCTVMQMVVLGWVMLKWIPFSPLIPAFLATFFLLWSGVNYIREGFRQLTSV